MVVNYEWIDCQMTPSIISGVFHAIGRGAGWGWGWGRGDGEVTREAAREKKRGINNQFKGREWLGGRDREVLAHVRRR